MEGIREEINVHRNILLLGFGIEGKSTYRFIRKFFPDRLLTIADRSHDVRHDVLVKNDRLVDFKLGDDYLNDLSDFDWIIKSPGISLRNHPMVAHSTALISQTDLFLKYFRRQTVSITGTKGKSTTSSLIYHILRKMYNDVLLVGNIGIPAFDCLDKITLETIVVYESSSHQLEFVTHSPHIGILLNIYEEHLDHHATYADYQKAKFNIVKFQQGDDIIIFNKDNDIINTFIANSPLEHQRIPFSSHQRLVDGFFIENDCIYRKDQGHSDLFYDGTDRKNLIGYHNLLNMIVAATVCRLFSVPDLTIVEGFRDFKSLPHRLEYFGNYHGIDFYNDSISTIPESTIEALKALKVVDTVILGGYDRGISYAPLVDYLTRHPVRHVILIGDVGRRIYQSLSELCSDDMQCYMAKDYREVLTLAFQFTRPQTICLLSPAASSYDQFKNFQERGNHFKKLVSKISNQRKYDIFRQNYPTFFYESYTYGIVDGDLCIEYLFNVSDQYSFRPKIRIPSKSFYQYQDVSKSQYDNLVFHIGMVELISYWKATCSPTLRIKPHALSEHQIKWWKKFYFHGLGEFFYRNSISNIDLDNFMDIESVGENLLSPHHHDVHDAVLIPVGGGKDSIVTLELLKEYPGTKRPLLINLRQTQLRVIELAGYQRADAIEIERILDSQLFVLNEKGFLNGHTPFSGLIAFLTLLMGALTKSKHIVLSNESSANESTVHSSSINHQYSKSYEFEADFRWYVREYMSSTLNYFSFLRPLNELQISQVFSSYEKYFPVFKSCNVGSKQDRWCNACSKCLFTFIILSPFIQPKLLESIFGENLLDKVQLEHEYQQLIGETEHKPFECVGTNNEVKQALFLSFKYYSEGKPYLLQVFEKQEPSFDHSNASNSAWEPHHFLSDAFHNFIRANNYQ